MSTMVLIELAVKPESVDDMKTLMKELLPDTRAYDGCQSVDFYDNTETKGNMVLYEIWDSRAHQERYLQWRSETGTLAPLQALVTAPPKIQYFDKERLGRWTPSHPSAPQAMPSPRGFTLAPQPQLLGPGCRLFRHGNAG